MNSLSSFLVGIMKQFGELSIVLDVGTVGSDRADMAHLAIVEQPYEKAGRDDGELHG